MWKTINLKLLKEFRISHQKVSYKWQFYLKHLLLFIVRNHHHFRNDTSTLTTHWAPKHEQFASNSSNINFWWARCLCRLDDYHLDHIVESSFIIVIFSGQASRLQIIDIVYVKLCVRLKNTARHLSWFSRSITTKNETWISWQTQLTLPSLLERAAAVCDRTWWTRHIRFPIKPINNKYNLQTVNCI